jgi:periodic tryptophan protein 1
MISSLAWVPPGAASTTPKYADVPEEELEHLAARARVVARRGRARGDDEDEDEEDEDDEDAYDDDDEDGSDSSDWEEVAADEEELEDLDEMAADEEDAKTTTSRAVAKALAVSKAAKGVVDDLAELNMDAYDDEEEDERAAEGRLFGSGKLTHHEGNEDDPYMTIKDSDDDEEDEAPDDMTMAETDLVILAARTDEDVSHLEVWVYEEAGVTGSEETNLYVHHDVLLPAFPLCVSWLNCAPKSGTNEVNCAAIGTMYPGIEIWDLDCVDAVEPVTTLGGYSEEAIKTAGKKDKKGKKSSKPLKGGSHEDAVMGLSWNREFRNVLASSSADKTVKIWDIATETAQHTLNHHKDKVQACEWNPAEPTVLLTGSYDKTAQVVDVRAPEEASLTWKVGADVECAIWHAGSPTQFLVSNEDGMVMCFDTRMGSKSDCLFKLQAHDKATTALSMTAGAPGLLTTCSTDKVIKLWDLNDGKPNLLSQHQPQVGAIFACGFSPSVPYLIAAAGSKGTVAVWDIMSEASVREAHGKTLEQYYRVK